MLRTSSLLGKYQKRGVKQISKVIAGLVNFAGNEQALRGYLTNLRTRVRDDDAQRMLDYIQSYNSLMVESKMKGREIFDPLSASNAQAQIGESVVHDAAYTDQTVNSRLRVTRCL